MFTQHVRVTPWRCRRGASAVEFALVAPILLILLFAVITLSSIMAIYSDIQQLAAESARSSIAGLSDTERDSIARAFVSTNATAYPLLDTTKLNVATMSSAGTPGSFRVTVSYDMSGSFIFALATILPLPPARVTRSAVVEISS